ncbi:MAG: hypothetical protein ACO1SV_21675 [Fimbriimonas sp.]
MKERPYEDFFSGEWLMSAHDDDSDLFPFKQALATWYEAIKGTEPLHFATAGAAYSERRGHDVTVYVRVPRIENQTVYVTTLQVDNDAFIKLEGSIEHEAFGMYYPYFATDGISLVPDDRRHEMEDRSLPR